MQNAIEDLHNLMLATGTNDFGNVADSSYIAFIAGFESDLIWKSALGGSNDDAQVYYYLLQEFPPRG